MSSRQDDATKERIREASDVVDVVEECVPLRKAGSNFKACCPFHEEKTPSFNVHPGKQIWHCFGCGAGGDVFAFVMQYHGMTFPEALRYLANRAGVALPERRERPDEVGRDEVLRVNARYAAWYQTLLLRERAGAPARDYLAARGIHIEVARTFGFGYAPDQWDAACTAPGLRDLGRKPLEAAGLARPRTDGSLYDLFRNRIMIPIYGSSEDVVGFGGRTIGDEEPKYINSPETPVFRKGTQLYNLPRARRAIQQAGRALLVEGYFDAVVLAAAGFQETVATCGTALTPQQAKLLARHSDRVVVAYDGDAAGHAAAEKAAGLLLEAGVDVGFVVVPDGGDPDQYLREHGPERFGELLAGALDFVDFVLWDAGAVQQRPIEQRATFADRLAQLSGRIGHPVRRTLYREKIAARLGLEATDVAPLEAGGPAAPAAAPEAPARPVLRERERELLRFTLSNVAEFAQYREEAADACEGMSPVVQAIVLRAAQATPGLPSTTALLEATETEAERQVLRELELEPDERHRYPPEWWHEHVALRMLEVRLPRTRDALARAQKAGEATHAAELAAEVQTLVTRRQQIKEALHAVGVETVRP